MSTIMKVISIKDGDLLSHFDIINQNDFPIFSRITGLPTPFRSTPHQKNLIDNHIDANKSKIKGRLYLEYIFCLCKKIKDVTKILGFHLMLKTNDLQDDLYTTMVDDINVTKNNLYLLVPNLIPPVETQLMFNEATQNNFKISFDECYTERRLKLDMILHYIIGLAQQVNAPKSLIYAHQTKDRKDSSNKNKKNTLFDHLHLRQYYVEIDGQIYRRDSLLKNYEENDYVEQYKKFKSIF